MMASTAANLVTPQQVPVPKTVGCLQEAALQDVFERLDGTTLTRAGAVCRTWRSVASFDPLWRNLVHRERDSWIADDNRPKEPPLWAIETPRLEGMPAPKRSWRQAYRLLAILERGRPDGGEPIPSYKLSSSSVRSCRPEKESKATWVTPEAACKQLMESDPGNAWAHAHVQHTMVGSRRQVTSLDGVTAVRDVRGSVVLAWSDSTGPRSFELPLRQRGCLAAEVLLHRAEPSDGPGVGPVHVLTRSNERWLRWEPDSLEPAGYFVGRRGRIIRVRGQACWLAAGYAEGTYDRFGLYDLKTGCFLEGAWDNHRIAGAAMLTEYGPLVGWVNSDWHVRICWTTRPTKAALPENMKKPVWRQSFWGNRPLRLDTRHLPATVYVTDMALDEDEPGRVNVTLEARHADTRLIPTRAFIDGWGGCKFDVSLVQSCGSEASVR